MNLVSITLNKFNILFFSLFAELNCSFNSKFSLIKKFWTLVLPLFSSVINELFFINFIFSLLIFFISNKSFFSLFSSFCPFFSVLNLSSLFFVFFNLFISSSIISILLPIFNMRSSLFFNSDNIFLLSLNSFINIFNLFSFSLFILLNLWFPFFNKLIVFINLVIILSFSCNFLFKEILFLSNELFFTFNSFILFILKFSVFPIPTFILYWFL